MKLATALPDALQALTAGRNCIPVHRAFENADIEAKAHAAARKYGVFKDVDPSKLGAYADRDRLFYTLAMQQRIEAQEAAAAGRVFGGNGSFVMNPADLGMGANGAPRLAIETTGAADIADWTKQQIAFVRDLAEQWVIPEICTTVAMTGPTAFVHRLAALRGDSDAGYAQDSHLLVGNDPYYSDCPTECTDANDVDLNITSELVEYTCKRLKGQMSYVAAQAAQSQYGVNLEGEVRYYILEKLKRDVQNEVIDDMAANVGDTIDWDANVPGGGYYASANPDEWRSTLYDQIVQADADIVADPEGRVGGATMVLGDLNAVSFLAKLNPFRIRTDFSAPATLNGANIDRMNQYFQVEKAGIYPLVRVPTMASWSLLVQRKDDNDPTYVYAPWVALQSLGMFLDPATACMRVGAIHLYGKKAVRPGRMVGINITPETT